MITLVGTRERGVEPRSYPSKARPDHQQAFQGQSPKSERLLLFSSSNCRDAKLVADTLVAGSPREVHVWRIY